MFETPQEVKPSASKGLWIVVAIAVVVLGAAAYFFVETRGGGNKPGPTAQAKGPADPVHDLKIQRATMAKHRNGTMSVWSVSLENKSSAYTYSKIKYETTYIGGDGRVLMSNTGTLGEAIGPGEEKSYEANDPLYPDGTARYNFKITSASSAVQQ